MNLLLNVLSDAWHLLLESSVYVIFGLLVSGLLRVFFTPTSVSQHLGKGRFKSVFKAAFFGIPIPLCSCGVLPAAVSLKKQGANNGATTAFLISTPESGIDSIAITYALLDLIMTITRPVVAFISAITAGLAENLMNTRGYDASLNPDLSCPVDACCDGEECLPEKHKQHHTFTERIKAGFIYAFTDVWGDIAGWFLVGLLLAGLITALIPEEVLSRYLGGGLHSMIIMLVFGIPLYICATASTPIAAALILKGISPGTALVFLLAGPATNVTSLTVLFGILGKRTTAIYLSTIALSAVLFGLALDQVYAAFGISAQAVAGQAAEIIPMWARWTGAFILLLLSGRPIGNRFMGRFKMKMSVHNETHPEVKRPSEIPKPLNSDTST